MPVAGGVGSPLLYAVIVGYLGIVVSTVYSAVFMLVGGAARGSFGAFGDRPEVARMLEAFSGWGGIIGQLLFGPFGIVIGLFVSTAITHVMLLLLDGARQGFEATFRVRSYAMAATVLAIVPFCGGAIGAIWSLVICIIGLAEAQRIPVWKAALAVLLPIVLCCCCCAVGAGMFSVAAAPALRVSAPAGRLPLGAILGGIAVLGAAAVGLLHLDRLPYTVCYLKAFTGIPCPTCGSTRAVGCLAHGDLAGAFAMNPLATAALLALVPWALADLGLLTRGRALGLSVSPGVGRALRLAAVVTVLANWAYLIAAGR